MSILDVDGFVLTLQGHVENLDEDELSVTLGGIAFGTFSCDANGDFFISVAAFQIGEITAEATDLWGQASNLSAVAVSSDPPTICEFSATRMNDTVWSFQGRVTDEDPEGLTVYLGGLASLNGVTATVQADGTFSVTCNLQPDETGSATAMTYDWFGQESNEALALVS